MFSVDISLIGIIIGADDEYVKSNFAYSTLLKNYTSGNSACMLLHT